MSEEREVLSFDELHAADIIIKQKAVATTSELDTDKTPTSQQTSASLADVEQVFDYKHQPDEQQAYELKLKDFVGMLKHSDRLYTRRKSRFATALSTQEAATVDKAAIIDKIKAEIATESFSLAQRQSRRLFVPYALMYIDNDAVTLEQSLNSLAQYCDRGVLLFNQPLPNLKTDQSLEIAQNFVKQHPGFKIIQYPLPILPADSKVVLDRFAMSELHRYWLLDLVYNYGLLHLKTLVHNNGDDTRALLFMAKPSVIYEPRLLEYAHRYLEQAAQFYDCVYLNDLGFVSETPDQFFTNLNHVLPQTEQNLEQAQQTVDYSITTQAQAAQTIKPEHESVAQVEANAYVKVYGKTDASDPQAFTSKAVRQYQDHVHNLAVNKQQQQTSYSATSFDSDVENDPIARELRVQALTKRFNADLARVREINRAQQAQHHLVNNLSVNNDTFVSTKSELTEPAVDNQFDLATNNTAAHSSKTKPTKHGLFDRIKHSFEKEAEKVLEVESQSVNHLPYDIFDPAQKQTVETACLVQAQSSIQAHDLSQSVLEQELKAHALNVTADDDYAVTSAHVLTHNLDPNNTNNLNNANQLNNVLATDQTTTVTTTNSNANSSAESNKSKLNRRITRLWKQGNSFDPLQFLCRLSCVSHFESKIVLPGSSYTILNENPYLNRKFVYQVRPHFTEHASLLSFGLFVGGVDFAHEKALAYRQLDTEYALTRLYHRGTEYHGNLHGFAEYFDVLEAFDLPKHQYSVDSLLDLANSFNYPPVSHELLKVVNQDLHQLKSKYSLHGFLTNDSSEINTNDPNSSRHSSLLGDMINNIKSHFKTSFHQHPQLTPAVAYDYSSVDYVKLFLGREYYINDYLGEFNTTRMNLKPTDDLYRQYEEEAAVLQALFDNNTKDLEFEYSGFEVEDDQRFEEDNPRQYLKDGQTYVFDKQHFFSKLS